MYNNIYTKYPYIVPGSIEKIPPGTKILCGKDDILISKGVICVIKCATDGAITTCRKTRIINIQDASQVKQCKACIKYLHNMKRRLRRMEKKEERS